MSGPGAGHIRKSSLEPSKGAGYAWLARNQGVSGMSGLGANMFGKPYWNPVRRPDMSRFFC
jgi:hypothetical protein